MEKSCAEDDWLSKGDAKILPGFHALFDLIFTLWHNKSRDPAIYDHHLGRRLEEAR